MLSIDIISRKILKNLSQKKTWSVGGTASALLKRRIYETLHEN